MQKSRFKLIPIINIILEVDGRILLMKRTDGFFTGGFWVVPGGHVDGNETLPAAAVRELKEELDIDVHTNDIQVVHVVHNLEADREKLDFFLKVNNFSGTIKNLEPHKCDTIEFFRYDALPAVSEMASTTLLALSSIAQGIFYSERGFTEGKCGFPDIDRLTFDDLQSCMSDIIDLQVREDVSVDFSREMLRLLDQAFLSDADIQAGFRLMLLMAASRNISIKNMAYAISKPDGQV